MSFLADAGRQAEARVLSISSAAAFISAACSGVYPRRTSSSEYIASYTAMVWSAVADE